MSNNDNIIQVSKAGDTAYMYPISSLAPFYMAKNKKMLEDAGFDLSKEGWMNTALWKSLESLKDKGHTPGSLFNGQGGDQGTLVLSLPTFTVALLQMKK